MTYIPILIAIFLAILDWIAAEKKIKPLEYITKPATMLALLWWIWSSVGLGGDMLWFTLGVVFCLAGDIFLMVPRNMFIFGLIAFLLGHVCYTIGFNNQSPYISLLGILIIVLLGIYFGWLYPKIAKGLDLKGHQPTKNSSVDLFFCHQYDGLFGDDDVESPGLANLSSLLGEPWSDVVFYIRFFPWVGSIYKSTFPCAIKDNGDISLRSIWNHTRRDFISNN